MGNGLRGDVWREFSRRFGDICIYEFYASTEGNIAFMNYTRKIGAIGRVNYLQKVSTSEDESICSCFPEYRDVLKAVSYNVLRISRGIRAMADPCHRERGSAHSL